MIRKKLIFVVFTTAIFSFGLKNPNEKAFKLEPIECNIKRIKQVKKFSYFFNETIDFIKQHEGWRSTPYSDINGFKTIGYGFITKYLPKQYRNYITKEEAHQIIVNKLRYNIQYAEKLYPKLTKEQLLAVAHLAYCKGFGTIINHNLHVQLKENSVEDSTWINFGKYEKLYPKYKLNRIYELKLFK